MKTIKDLLKTGTNRYAKIRQLARRQCEIDNRGKKCEWCGWNMHVEIGHIKPISSFPTDTDIEIVNHKSNLIVLCPNCHWLHDHPNKDDNRLCECGSKKYRTSLRCKQCADKLMSQYKRTDWPCKEELEKLINEFPMITIGKKFGVSGNAVKKWCNAYGIITGNRLGYWQQKRCKAI